MLVSSGRLPAASRGSQPSEAALQPQRFGVAHVFCLKKCQGSRIASSQPIGIYQKLSQLGPAKVFSGLRLASETDQARKITSPACTTMLRRRAKLMFNNCHISCAAQAIPCKGHWEAARNPMHRAKTPPVREQLALSPISISAISSGRLIEFYLRKYVQTCKCTSKSK